MFKDAKKSYMYAQSRFLARRVVIELNKYPLIVFGSYGFGEIEFNGNYM